MATTLNINRILHGTESRVYVDGLCLSEIQSIDVKENPEYESFYVNGSYTKAHRYIGSEISGSITVRAVDSYVLSQFKAAHKDGTVPAVTINIVLYDPQTKQSQRVVLYNVTFTENDLGSFETGTLISKDIPFTAEDYEVLEVIE